MKMVFTNRSVKIDGERYVFIPWYEDYLISTKSTIRARNTHDLIKPIIINNKKYVILQNLKCVDIIPVESLMLNIFVGKMPYPIKFKDGNSFNTSINNLKYEIPEKYINTTDYVLFGFKDIPGFTRYSISKNAVIYNKSRNIFMKYGYDNQNYQNLHLINDFGKDIHTKVHILLMLTHVPEKPDARMVCNHKDSIEYNNSLDNLEYVYQYENIYESYLCGDQSIPLKRTKDDVHNICMYIKNGKTNKEIISIMEVPKSEYHQYYVGIQDIRKKRTWKHISDLYF